MSEGVSLDLTKPPPDRDYANRPPPGPIFADVEVELIGTDSNAFALIERVRKALMLAGYRKEADNFVTQAFKQTSYDDLLVHITRTVHVK